MSTGTSKKIQLSIGNFNWKERHISYTQVKQHPTFVSSVESPHVPSKQNSGLRAFKLAGFQALMFIVLPSLLEKRVAESSSVPPGLQLFGTERHLPCVYWVHAPQLQPPEPHTPISLQISVAVPPSASGRGGGGEDSE